MDVDLALRTTGIVLAIGLVAIPLAQVLRLPSMVVLVALGIVAGPNVLDLVDVPIDSPGPSLLFSLGVALILFHGGLGISLRVISATMVGLLLLAIPGVMITAGIVAAAIVPLFGVPWDIALLCGAVLAATDPAILVPLFERLGLRPRVGQTVIAESALNDPMSAVLALTLAGVVTAGGLTGAFTADGALVEFLRSIAIGLGIGLIGGVVIAALLSTHRFGVLRESIAATLLAVVALEYFTAETIGGSPYLAAFIAGLIVANKDLIRIDRDRAQEEQLDRYVAQTVDIIVIAIFVILGLNLDVDLLLDNIWAGLGVMAVFILIARPATVAICLGLDRRSRWTRQEATFIAWCRETGVVPVSIAALLLADGVPGARLAATLVTFAVIVTLLLQATTAGWAARRLGLVDEAPASDACRASRSTPWEPRRRTASVPTMNRIRIGFRFAGASWRIVRDEPSLAVFPFLSVAFALIYALLIVLPISVVGYALFGDAQILWLIPLILFTLGASIGATFFGVAAAHNASEVMDGRDPTLGGGIAVARSRIGVIVQWALVNTTVGVLLQVIGDKAGPVAGTLIQALGGAAWSIASFFAIPILALEGLGPFATLKLSASTIRRKWGESLVGGAAIGIVSLLIALAGVGIVVLGALAVSGGVAALGIPVIVIGVLVIIAGLVVGSVIGAVFRVVVYRYATTGAVAPGFDETELQQVFRPRGGRI